MCHNLLKQQIIIKTMVIKVWITITMNNRAKNIQFNMTLEIIVFVSLVAPRIINHEFRRGDLSINDEIMQ